jgi:CubicO group peptidase (beta-lactamase class C family)
MYYLLYLDEKNTEMALETEQTPLSDGLRFVLKTRRSSGRQEIKCHWPGGGQGMWSVPGRSLPVWARISGPMPNQQWAMGPTFELNQAHGPLVGGP